MLSFRRLFLLPCLILAVLTVFSAYNRFPGSLTGKTSAELSENTTEDNHIKRTDYVDESGQVTFAADKGYATVVRTRDEKKRTIREEYLDETGQPVMLPGGYSVVTRTYEDENHLVRICYLDISGHPVMNQSGYAEILRTYNDIGKADTDTYYDVEGHPSRAANGYYGLRREYNEDKKVSAIWYLDEEGQPVMTSDGYACVRREYNEEGKLAKVSYYNTEGEPVSTRSRQHGFLYEDGQKTYVDTEGNPVFRLDKLLHGRQILVITAGIVLMLVSIQLKGRSRILIFLAYLAFVIFMTLWHREWGDSQGNFELFWSYRQFFTRPSLRQEILNNIWLFIPLGALLYKPGTKCWMIILLVSVGIEVTQYLTGTGLCEFDDIISNTLGGFIGWLAAAGLQGNRQKREEHHGGT